MPKIVLCGPPHSGKSCLREGLKKAIKQMPSAPYPYVLTACPDGEGAWFSEAAQNDPELARRLKDAYKAKFTLEFAEVRAEWVRNATTPLTLIDVGGRTSDENRLIMAEATHAVILAGDLSKVAEWQEFCAELGLKVVAVIHSDYHGTEDRIDTLEPVLTGSVHHLERGEDNSTRPMVQALARLLIDLVAKVEEKKMAAYNINIEGDVLKVGFGDPAQNDEIVRDAVTRLDQMVGDGELVGGSIIKINGPASLPVAVAITHAVAHVFETVAVYDPKLGKYVVAVSHGATYRPGDLID